MGAPSLRFRKFHDSWTSSKLSDLSNIYDGTHTTPDYKDVGIPFYSVEHLTSGNFSNTKFISKEVFEKENKRVKLERGDVLMTRIGDIGTAKYLDWDVEASFYVSLALIKPRKVNGLYLSQYIMSPVFQRELHERTIHVAFPKKINLGEIGECLIETPSEPEQQKIASFLSKIDQKISLLSKKHELLIKYKKGVMQKIFNQEIRFKDKDGKDFPEWEERKFEDVVQIQGGYAFKSTLFGVGLNKVLKIGDINPYISLKNFTGEISTETPDIRFSVQKGDYLMALSGATFGKVGKIIDDGIAFINQRVATFRTNQIHEFFYQFIQSDKFKNYIKSIPSASAQPNISNSDIGRYFAPIPSIEEQQKIASFLSSIDQKIKNLGSQIELTKQYKQGLLQQMFI